MRYNNNTIGLQCCLEYVTISGKTFHVANSMKIFISYRFDNIYPMSYLTCKFEFDCTLLELYSALFTIALYA